MHYIEMRELQVLSESVLAVEMVSTYSTTNICFVIQYHKGLLSWSGFEADIGLTRFLPTDKSALFW